MSKAEHATRHWHSPLADDAAGVAWAGAPLRVYVPAVPHCRRYFLVKTAVDRAGAAVLLVMLAPLLVLLAVLVKVTSPGPVLFTQRRAGSRRLTGDGTCWQPAPFRMLKFRSMAASADESLHLQHIRRYTSMTVVPTAGGAGFKLANDLRVTRFGRFLRRTSLDELPQLVNVLLGHMSLVGPRPVPVYEAEMYRPKDYIRFAALPGVTGLWQVSGRGAVGFDEMIALDAQQVTRRSLRLDVTVLLRTLPAVIRAAGAS
jgi:lipopolysaccharide/colanic/teichoic acid biosynthesis glycosyltransferase